MSSGRQTLPHSQKPHKFLRKYTITVNKCSIVWSQNVSFKIPATHLYLSFDGCNLYPTMRSSNVSDLFASRFFIRKARRCRFFTIVQKEVTTRRNVLECSQLTQSKCDVESLSNQNGLTSLPWGYESLREVSTFIFASARYSISRRPWTVREKQTFREEKGLLAGLKLSTLRHGFWPTRWLDSWSGLHDRLFICSTYVVVKLWIIALHSYLCKKRPVTTTENRDLSQTYFSPKP